MCLFVIGTHFNKKVTFEDESYLNIHVKYFECVFLKYAFFMLINGLPVSSLFYAGMAWNWLQCATGVRRT